MTLVSRGRNGLAAAGGGALATGVAVLGSVTGRIKPFHPHGELRAARVLRHGAGGGTPDTGAAWIDTSGESEALVRFSGGVGVPRGWPDIHGLALTTGQGDARSDVLVASTGVGSLTRHLLVPTRAPGEATLTTLLPYRSPHGPLYLAAAPDPAPGRAADPLGQRTFTLSWARTGGPWYAFARLEVGDVLTSGDTLTFDPVLHVPPGLEQYGWVRSLREPAYATARLRSGRTVRSDRTAADLGGSAVLEG